MTDEFKQSKVKWGKLEHDVYKLIQHHSLNEALFFIAVSGGADSMALLHCLAQIKKSEQLVVLHFHHGQDTKNHEEQSAFRDRALNAVQKYCRNNKLQFYSAKADNFLTQEEQCREARYQFFEEIQNSLVKNQLFEKSVLVTAHHQNDLLETNLIKLIRGCGLEALKNFDVFNGQRFRPFLNIKKNEILTYLKHNNLDFIEDPSNSEADQLRNFLRNQWLPQLEAYRQGAVDKFSESLQRAIQESRHSAPQYESLFHELQNDKDVKQLILAWSSFLNLSQNEQLQLIVQVFKRLNIRHFTKNHVFEVKKRLDKNQKEHTFSVCGVKWVINAQQIMVYFEKV